MSRCAALRKSFRVTYLTFTSDSVALWPHRCRKGREVADEPVDIGLVVLDRHQPLLDLAPRRQEDAAIVLKEPMRVAVGIPDGEEVTEVAHRPGRKHHAPLGAYRHDPRVQVVLRDLA